MYTLLLLLIPLITILLILPINNIVIIKKLALFSSIIELFIVLLIWILFDYNNPEYINTLMISNIRLGIDSISLIFIILTVLIMPIAILAGFNIKKKIKTFMILVLLTELIFMLIFTSLDILLFYITFESSLIPMFFLIGLYGSDSQGMFKGKINKEKTRIYASYKFFLMTFAGSLLMLLSIIKIYTYYGTTDYLLISTFNIDNNLQIILWLGFFISFAIKTPLLPVHQWLPLAHTEAPLTGSIILAALMLKLATYGFIKYSLILFPYASTYFLPLIMTLCIISLIYSSFSTLRQIDMKKIIAYSSIGHMAIIIMALFSNNYQGITGALFLSFAHGLTSPALFICVGILYNIFHTRIILYFKGLSIYMPLLSSLTFIFILANMSTPLTSNFIGEFISFISIFNYHFPFTAIIFTISIILVPVYSIYFYIKNFFGSYSIYLKSYQDINILDFNLLITLLGFILFTGIFPNSLLNILELPVSMIIIH
uniref:NADH-ubiquinone oxidoreductase chain 4 n=1 Tax=Zancudomyces culisetae TaxID=1213189 RepID=Q3T4B9_ZANCU|nr:NADH dehydrogenase subunit 4 [Zancudomyces culisetae]AAW49495.1 NADH dehydrogenase subunit 4 [Zancudomyces culisetae]